MFAGARERVGTDVVQVDLELPVTVLELKHAIATQFELLSPLVEYGRIAIDNEFVDDTAIIDVAHATCAFALIPPVSGG